MKYLSILAFFFWIHSANYSQTTLNVPSQYPTIQAALNAARYGNIVLVQPGVYKENIIWPDIDGIQLIAAGDTSNTIIDGNKLTSTIIFLPKSIITNQTLIKNFKIINGYASNGGGISISKANPSMDNVKLENNSAGNGGGIYCTSSSPILKNICFYNNSASSGGGGICFNNNAYGRLDSCIISNNKAGFGAGIQIAWGTPGIYNCNIINNKATYKGGGIYCYITSTTISKTDFIYNSGGESDDIAIGSSGKLTVKSCNFYQKSSTQYPTIYNESDNNDLVTIMNCNFIATKKALENANNTAFINATNNYWNSPTGPLQIKDNPNGTGASVGLLVNTIPFLTVPDTTAPPLIVKNVKVLTTDMNGVTLQWDSCSSSNVKGYKIYYDTTPFHMQYSSCINTYDATKFTIQNLRINTTYYFSVTAYDNSGNESWYSSEVKALTRKLEINNLKLKNEELVHVISHKPFITFDYFDAMGLKQLYCEIQVSSKPDFSSIDLWNSGNIIGDSTSISYNGKPLSDGLIYYLRVRVCTTDNVLSSWVSLSFRMNSKPTAPSAIRPNNQQIIKSVFPELVVVNSSDIEKDNIKYVFELASDSLFSKILLLTNETIQTNDSTKVTVNIQLTDNTQYWWRAKAYDGYEYGDYMPRSTFIIDFQNDSPSAFNLLQPSQNTQINNLRPVFKWMKALDPDPQDKVTYTLYLDTPEPGIEIINADTLTQLQLPYDLKDNTIYYWKVVATDIAGLTKENNGAFKKFTINTKNLPPYPFNLVTPSVNSIEITQTPLFYWEMKGDPNPEDSLNYHLYYSPDSLLNNPTHIVLKENAFIPTTPLNDHSIYYWKVVANDSGSTGAVYQTPRWAFFVYNSPLLIFPVNNQINQPTLFAVKWRRAPGALSYRLEISNDSLFKNIIIKDVAISDTAKQIPELSEDTKYYWRLSSNRLDGISSWSKVWTFNTYLKSPNNLKAISKGVKSIELSWTDNSSNESGYIIERKTGDSLSVNSFVVVDTLSANTTKYTDTKVQDTTKYTYRVYAIGKFTSSEKSNQATISTILSVETNNTIVPQNYSLTQNYPNPFNPTTKIKYSLPVESEVQIRIYNALGEVIKELVNEVQSSGYKEITLDAADLSSGIYFYIMHAKALNNDREIRLIKKAILLK